MAWVTVPHGEVPPGAGPCYGADWGMVTYDDEFVAAEPLPPPPPDVVAEEAHKNAHQQKPEPQPA